MARINKIAIYDMDGTIVNSLHRYRTVMDDNNVEKIDLEYWRANEHKASQDTLLPLASQYQKDIQNENTYVIIATARILRKADMQYIQEVLGMPDYIVSRGENDTRSGRELKIKGLQKFFNLRQFKIAMAVFYEDNIEYLKAVCDHFNITGIYVPSKQGH